MIYRVLKNAKHLLDKKKEKIRYWRLSKKAQNLFELYSNKNIIVLSSDCVGGRLMNDYRLPVNTPTVNIWYSDDGFLKICEKPEEYFKLPIVMGEKDDEGHYTGTVGDVICHFGHEDDAISAEKKWKRGCKQFFRAQKGDYEICVIMNDRNHFNESFIDRFETLPYKNKIMFTHRPYKEAPHTFYMIGEDSLPCVKTMTLFENYLSTKRRYDRFDFYQWFYNMLK